MSTLREKVTFAKLNFRSHEGIKSKLYRKSGSKSSLGRRINSYIVGWSILSKKFCKTVAKIYKPENLKRLRIVFAVAIR